MRIWFHALVWMFATQQIQANDAVLCRSEPRLFVFEDPRVEGSANLGYRNVVGQTVISGRFTVAFDFTSFGYAFADGNYINSKGEVILRPFLYDNGPDYFREGLARYLEDGKTGFVDQCLKVKIEARFDWASPFTDGFAKVCNDCIANGGAEHQEMSGGLWGVIDRSGTLVVKLEHPGPRDALEALPQNPGQWMSRR